MGTQQSNDEYGAWAPQQQQQRLVGASTQHRPTATQWRSSSANHRVQQRWALDVDHATCMGCAKRFYWLRRRHHCRKCGGVFCDACCPVVPQATVVGDALSSRQSTADDLAGMLLSMGGPPERNSSVGGVGGGGSSARLTASSARRSSRNQVSSLQPGVGSELHLTSSGAGGGSYSSLGRRSSRSSDLAVGCGCEAPAPLSDDGADDGFDTEGGVDMGRDAGQRQGKSAANPTTTRVCKTCTSPLMSLLSDALLTFIMRFLRYDAQDKMMRTCTRLLLAVYVPFQRLDNLGERFMWREPQDVLHLTDSTLTLRCTERRTGSTRCLQIFLKRHLVSRRLWRQLQRYIDTMCDVASHRAFPHLYDVVQTHDLVVVVMELVDPRRFVPLSRLLAGCEVSSGAPAGMASACDHVLAAALPKILYNAAVAVEHLHVHLHVAHRRLSPGRFMVECTDARWVPAAADNSRSPPPHPPSYDTVLLGLRHGRILGDGKLPSGVSFLKQRHALATGAEGGPPSVGDVGAAQEGDGAAAPAAPLQQRPRRRPPPIPIPVDRALLRKSAMYRKAAENRSLALAAGKQTRNHFTAVEAQPIPVRIASAAGGGDLLNSGAGFLISSAILQSESLLLSPKDQRLQEMRVVDDGVLPVVTPRGTGVQGFTSPEVLRILTSREVVVASLARTGREVKACDLYALGVLFLVGLRRYAHYFLFHDDDDAFTMMPENVVGAALGLYDRIVASLQQHAASAATEETEESDEQTAGGGKHRAAVDMPRPPMLAPHKEPHPHRERSCLSPAFFSALLSWVALILRLLSPDPMDRGDITATVMEMRAIYRALYLSPMTTRTAPTNSSHRRRGHDAALTPDALGAGSGPGSPLDDQRAVVCCTRCRAPHACMGMPTTGGATTAVPATAEGALMAASLSTPSAPPAPRHARPRTVAMFPTSSSAGPTSPHRPKPREE